MVPPNAHPVNKGKRAALFQVAICLAWVLLAVWQVKAEGQTFPSDPLYPILKDIQYGFTLRNRTNRLVKEAQFWTTSPVKRSSTQKCLALEVSHPYRLIEDDLGNQVLYFRFENLAPHEIKQITISFRLGLTDRPNPVPLNKDSRFLKPEPCIESDHPEIRRLAEKLAASTPQETAEKIFRWVAGSIHYAGYLREPLGALYALKNRQGDCTEYMALFTALCRANGIPARGLGGYVLLESGKVAPASYHNWAEFYQGGAWNLSDPQRKIFMKNPSQYLAMRIIGGSSSSPMGDAQRFRSSREDIEVKMISPRGFEGI